MALLLFLPLALILFVVLLWERRSRPIRHDELPFADAVAMAVAQYKAGSIPYATCPSCLDVLSVEVDRSVTAVGTMNVRCRCGGSNAVVRI